MTVETKLAYDEDYIKQFSKSRQEPDWMTTLRLEAIQQAHNLDMRKPDKTNISRWKYTRSNHEYATGETIQSLSDLQKQLKEFFDENDAHDNVLIQRNQSVTYVKIAEELKEKGVIFTDLF